jgi:hypothetical protein
MRPHALFGCALHVLHAAGRKRKMPGRKPESGSVRPFPSPSWAIVGAWGAGSRPGACNCDYTPSDLSLATFRLFAPPSRAIIAPEKRPG